MAIHPGYDSDTIVDASQKAKQDEEDKEMAMAAGVAQEEIQ